jgi:flagellin
MLGGLIPSRLKKGNEMANIGATTAFYKVETSLTRANSEVSKSMERLATGKQNANAGDRSSYVAMADTFRLDFVGTKAGIKGASVTMGYLETGMRVLDSASALLSRLQELAVLGANDTNTTADHEAINLEAEAIADEFNRLMTTSTYKGRDVFNTTAGSLYVSMGGRDQEMTFGIGTINYGALYGTGTSERTIEQAITTGTAVDGPNKGAKFNLAHLPSDAVVIKELGKATSTGLGNGAALTADKTYIVTTIAAATDVDYDGTKAGPVDQVAKKMYADTSAIYRATEASDANNLAANAGNMLAGDVLVVNAQIITADMDATIKLKEVLTGDHAFKAGDSYVITSLGNSDGNTATALSDAAAILNATSVTGGTLVEGQRFTVNADASIAQMAHLNALTQSMTFSGATDTLTKDIEAIQALVNTARVQAGSQYAAMESAVNYTTDLPAQYELGYNTVNDVNFSMETAHLAKNQILQQAATAMLAQANSGQQGLLQLIS